MFDKNSYENIPDEDRALSYIRYYSRKAGVFYNQLISSGTPETEARELVDTLWERVIKGCRKFNIPLTFEAEHVAKRLNL
jgi:hypothetical protein